MAWLETGAGVLDRLVGAFGDGNHDDLVRLSEVKLRRADKVTDIFDQAGGSLRGIEVLQGGLHHLGVEVAAFSGVDLDGLCPGAADAVGVVARFLVAFDHGDGKRLRIGAPDRGREQFGLA